nr:MAG TPA: hypothetical protein [Caudoviricetes sp.]
MTDVERAAGQELGDQVTRRARPACRAWAQWDVAALPSTPVQAARHIPAVTATNLEYSPRGGGVFDRVTQGGSPPARPRRSRSAYSGT